MEATAQSLEDQYKTKSLEELVALQRQSGLTDLARRVIAEELGRRGITAADRDQMHSEEVQRNRMWETVRLVPIYGRLVARAMDLFIVMLLSFLPNILFISDSRAQAAAGWLALSYFLLADALPHGQSVGKKALGIAVSHALTDRPCTAIRSVLRNVTLPLMILDWAPALGGRRQRAGDLLAGTIVIYSRRKPE